MPLDYTNPPGIVLIDDNPGDVRLFEATLRNLYETATLLGSAHTAAEGLTVVLDKKPDLVFLDLKLPDADGMELIGTIKSNCPDTGIVVITGNQSEEAPMEALACGADDYITKGEMNAQILQRVIRFAQYRRRVDKQLVAEKERAEQAAMAKSRFLSSMSHEIRTPLNAIIGFAEILSLNTVAGEPLTEEDADFIRMIHTSGSHLLKLLNDILDFNKLDLAKVDYVPEVVNIHQLVVEITEIFQMRAQQKQLDLKLIVDDELPEEIESNDKMLRQILYNIIGNAIKFTDKGTVTVEVQTEMAEEPQLVLKVTDMGIGIPTDKLEIIFEDFEQLHEQKDNRYPGTGLGLSISRKLCELMGGSIKVCSKLGEGSCFFVTLPLTILTPAIRREHLAAKSAAVNLAEVKESMRILIAEEDFASNQILKHYLDRLGYHYDALDENDITQAEIDPSAYHCFLIGLNSENDKCLRLWESTRRRCEEGQNGPAGIAVTGDNLSDTHKRCMEAGISTVLSKPLSIQKLERTLNQTLSFSSSSRSIST